MMARRRATAPGQAPADGAAALRPNHPEAARFPAPPEPASVSGLRPAIFRNGAARPQPEGARAGAARPRANPRPAGRVGSHAPALRAVTPRIRYTPNPVPPCRAGSWVERARTAGYRDIRIAQAASGLRNGRSQILLCCKCATGRRPDRRRRTGRSGGLRCYDTYFTSARIALYCCFCQPLLPRAAARVTAGYSPNRSR